MSASKRKLEANQKNSQKSTGPKTAGGKETVKTNPLKHGIYSENIIVNSPHLRESTDEYRQLLSALIEELQPQTEYQLILVRKIANCLWRSRRIINAETSSINRQLRTVDSELDFESMYDEKPDPDEIEDPESERIRAEIKAQKKADMVGILSIPRNDFCINILHYEMRLDRQMSRAYSLLRLLQLRNSLNLSSEDE